MARHVVNLTVWLVFICQVAKLCTKKLPTTNYSHKNPCICKSQCEKISGTFLCGHGVQFVISEVVSLNDWLQQTTTEPADWSLIDWSNVISNDISVWFDRSFEIWCCRLRSNWTEPISVNRSFEIRCCYLWSYCTRSRDGFAKPPSLFKRHTKQQLRKR